MQCLSINYFMPPSGSDPGTLWGGAHSLLAAYPGGFFISEVS
jgi:hypothetical protein